MTTASDDGLARSGTTAGDAPRGDSARREAMQETRYRAYERVFAALSPLGTMDDTPLSAEDRSYRQHAVVETLRDLELSRRRYLLLHPEEAAGDGATATS